MNEFALILLDRVVELIDWAVKMGEVFSESGKNIISELE
jgi:uncharacterized protein YlaN (UPF0358 family)